MKWKHIRIIDTTEGVYLNASDVHAYLRGWLYVFPSFVISTICRTLEMTHWEYLRARKNNAKNTRA